MSKQDRTWARTAADLERKQNFREVLGIATDARTYAAEAKKVSAEVAETTNGIALKVNNGLSAQFEVSVEETENEGKKSVFSLINGEATKIHFEADSILIESTNFTLQEDGTVMIKMGNIGGCTFDKDGNLIVPTKCLAEKLIASQINADGIVAKDVNLTGIINANGGSFGNAHITTEGQAYGRHYDGFSLSMDGSSDGTFFGISDNVADPYRAFLGLGLDTAKGVLISNQEISIGGINVSDVKTISWDEIYEAVQKIKSL